MFTLREEKALRVPGRDVWAVLDDFGAHHRFNPFIEQSSITNGVPVGEGAERVIRLYDGTVMRQRIVDYRPPVSMVIEVLETTQMIRHHLIEISVTHQGDDACQLAYTVSFQVPLGILGYPLGLYQKVVLRSRYAHVLRGLERYVAGLQIPSSSP
ncbi:MAG: SRPBCC family protein [Pseudomonadales bacterium]